MTTYYVSSEIGSDKNAGTSAAAAFASLQAAANIVKPGDTVEVMNGTYTNGGNDVLTISTSGTATAPITFEAAPGATPIIDSSGAWQGIEINASYITIKGFTIVGDAANYTLVQAMAGYSTGNSDLNGNGIGVALNAQNQHFHHIIIENNTIYNEPGGGIATIGADYLQILNNNVHDNAHWSAFGASGISIAASVNFDNGPAPHIIVRGNISVNNAELVPEYRANAITDGEGIILDSNWGYTGGFLVENNTTHLNSGPGIEALGSDNAVITGNTTTGDLTNPNLANEGEIFNNQSNNVTITNNVTSTAPPPPSSSLVTNGGFETGDFSGWTLSGNVAPLSYGPQVFITTNSYSGQYAAGFGAVASDGTISQNLTTVVGQSYTFDFWLANVAGGTDDFTAKIGGITELHLVNAAAQPYTHYTYTFTATSTSTPLELDFRQDTSEWHLDNVSVVPTGSAPPPPPPPGAPNWTTASQNLYQSMYGITVSATELNVLVQFSDAQAAYGDLIHVISTNVYVYQALGLALSDGPSFQNKFAGLANDTIFVNQAYADVFHHLGNPDQIQHFIDQVNFFDQIYTSSHAYGTDAHHIDILARAAVYGQMQGVAAENPFSVFSF